MGFGKFDGPVPLPYALWNGLFVLFRTVLYIDVHRGLGHGLGQNAFSKIWLNFLAAKCKKKLRNQAISELSMCFQDTIDEYLWRSKTGAYSTAPSKSSKQRLLYVAESTTETLQLSHDSLVRMLS